MARVLLLIALVLVAVACSSEPLATTVPPTTEVVTTTTEAAPDLASCMADEGLTVGTLSYNEDGDAILDRTFFADNELTDPAVKEALDACYEVLRDARVRIRVTYGPLVLQEITDQLTAYSECMRENGVDNWPDPIEDFDGSQIPFPLAPMTAGFADGDFGDANDLCEPLVVFSPF